MEQTKTGTPNTHGVTLSFGKHNGDLITRVPVGYLKWMVNVSSKQSDLAAAELSRRGTVTPELDVSGHAIDRASLRCRKIWHQDRGPSEGLHSWLVRVAGEALAKGEYKNGKVLWKGMKLVFEEDTRWPVLKSIMRTKGEANAEQMVQDAERRIDGD